MQSRKKSNECNQRDYESSHADRLRKHMAETVADKKQKKIAGMKLDMEILESPIFPNFSSSLLGLRWRIFETSSQVIHFIQWLMQ